jgi:hypothetical protein
MSEEEGFLGFSTSTGFTALNYCNLLKIYGFADQDCVVEDDSITLGSPEAIARRDDLQDRVLAASNQKCGQYFIFLHGNKADWELKLGGVSSLLAGAGAVVSHMPSAQAFSAAAGVASAARAERSQAYFANLAIEVVTSGIRSRRGKILEEIAQKRANHLKNGAGHVYYSVSGALSDAIEYHSTCNAVTGFEVAAESISRADHPGPEELKRFFTGFGDLGFSLEASPNAQAEPVDRADADEEPEQRLKFELRQ